MNLSFLQVFYVVLPIIGYIVIFVLTKQLGKNHRRAVGLAIDMSTFIFIFSVHVMLELIWQQPTLWIIMLIILSLATVVVIAHYFVKKEIVYRKVLKGIWRVNFAFFFCAYILLVITGIVVQLMTFLSI